VNRVNAARELKGEEEVEKKNGVITTNIKLSTERVNETIKLQFREIMELLQSSSQISLNPVFDSTHYFQFLPPTPSS
jgi:hypothetical protein